MVILTKFGFCEATNMGYAVCHLVKGKGSGAGRGKHNDREVIPPNADKDKQDLNIEVSRTAEGLKANKLGSLGSLKDRISERIKEGYNGKREIRSDATTHISIVLTGSHEDMKNIENDATKRREWIIANYEFIEKTYKSENVVGFAVHRDEHTMHIHATVVPLTKDGRLSAKEVIGGRDGLKNLQTEYALAMSNAGFEELGRGQEGSKAKHTDVKQYYGAVKEAIQDTELTKPLEYPTFSTGGLKTPDLPEFKPKTNLLGVVDKEDMMLQVNSLYDSFRKQYASVQAKQFDHITKQVNPIIQNVMEVAKKDRQKAKVLKLELDKSKLKERQKPLEKKIEKKQDFGRGMG